VPEPGVPFGAEEGKEEGGGGGGGREGGRGVFVGHDFLEFDELLGGD